MPARDIVHASRRDRVIFLSIILVGLVAALWRLGAKSLWLDEALTLQLARRPLLTILADTDRANPPLYSVLMHFWIALWGSSEVALRLPAVLCQAAAVALTGWVARLAGGARSWPWAMLLAALSPMPVFWAQTARHYTLFLALSLVGWGALFAWVRDGRPRWAAIYVAATILAAYTHHYWLFGFLAQQVWMALLIVRREAPWRSWGAVSLIILAAWMPWGVVVTTQVSLLPVRGFWIVRPGLGTFLETVRGYVLWGSVPGWFFLVHLGLALAGLVAIGNGLKPVRGVPGTGDGSPPAPSAVPLVLWFLVPLLVPFLVSLAWVPIFMDRYTIAAAPALYILVGRGMSALPRAFWRCAAVIMLAVLSLASLRGYYPWQMEDWRSVARDLGARVRPGDMVSVSPVYARLPLAYYYRGPLVPLPVDPAQLERGELRRALGAARASAARLWMVFRPVSPGDPFPLRGFLERRFPGTSLREEVSYGGTIALYGYDLPPARKRPGPGP